jgi:hypothetical protein
MDSGDNKLNKDGSVGVESDDNPGNTVILSTPKEGRLWFQERLTKNEDIGMPEFCEEFGYTCEQDADAAFSRVLLDSQLPLSSRITVETNYKRWQRNEGEGFWACRAVDYMIDVSTTKTVEDLVDRGQFFTGSDSHEYLRFGIDSIRFDSIRPIFDFYSILIRSSRIKLESNRPLIRQ